MRLQQRAQWRKRRRWAITHRRTNFSAFCHAEISKKEKLKLRAYHTVKLRAYHTESQR
jgi:hypothetical protein